MDENRPSIPPHDVDTQAGRDAEPIAAGVRGPADLSGNPAKNSTIVYCGDDEQVSRGFMLALRAMGIEANLPEGGVGPPRGRANPETEQ